MDRAANVDETHPIDLSTSYDEKQKSDISSISARSGPKIDETDGGHDNEKEATEEIGTDELEERDENGDKKDAVERVQSKKASIRDASSIPDGGLKAWLQVLGAFFLFFNSWGIINTFGSYQAYYESDLLISSSPSSISWIGSIQAFLLLVVGMIAGPIYDAGYFRSLTIVGSFLLVFGQMMLSLCTEYYQVLLAQAICMGIGCACLFVPSVAILSTYFTTKIATAVGIAASGSSLGGVIYPIVFHNLLPQIGFGWTTRVLGFMILGCQIIPIACMRVRVLPSRARSLIDLSAFRIPAYDLHCLGFFLGFVGLYMPFFYAQVYAIDEHITNENIGFYLLAIMNATSVFGRIVPNYVADKIGPFNVVIPCTIITSILCYCFIAVNSSAGIIVLMAFYGFFSGSFVSLPPSMIVHMSLDARDRIGTRMGQSFAIIACGVLIGTPIGGAILDARGFTSVWIFGGSMLMAGGICLVVARGLHKGWGLSTKA